MRLDLWLDSRRWWRRTEPFPHIVASNVFKATTYEALAKSFGEILDRGFSELPEGGTRFCRSMKGYDAYGYRMPLDIEGPLSVFVSREWHDMLAGIFGVDATDEIEAALHHHAGTSKTGWVHNDLNPGWFIDRQRPDGIIISDPTACNYQTGKSLRADATPYERVRAIALIFYLGNPPWKPGDGGETGLYKLRTARPEHPDAAVPPLNNTLVAFECTPYSFHTFLSNRSPRSTAIMWLHRRKEDVVERWGAGAIEEWR
jgi:2-oxoglutarate-Fe(II)-dependent oxygenase superfamily protein